MNAPVLADAAPSRTAPAWRPAIVPLCLGIVLLCLVFNQEVAAAVQTWWDSTAYNHCFLVIPIALYLLWDRKTELAGIPPVPHPAAALLCLPVGVVWLLAERLGIMEGRQIAVVTFAQVLFLSILGSRLYKAALGPLLYLYFLVPFGEFLTPRLQDVTTWFIRHGVDLLGIPAYIDGYVIEIPQGTFFVAEACAGLRFLIASIAFGCLYALLMYRRPERRALFILASIIVPIIANGFRGLGIVYLGYLLGSAQAAAADHVLYGWIFFSLVILLLIVIGLPFREDTLPAVTPSPDPAVGRFSPSRAFTGAVLVAVVAAIAPMLTAGLAVAASAPVAVASSIPVGPDCVATPLSAGGEPGTASQRVVCGGMTYDMAWQTFSPRATAGSLMAARRRLIRPVLSENLSESWLAPDNDRPRAWRIMHADNPPYALAVAMWVDGRSVRPGLPARALMAIDSVLGARHAPVVMTVTPVVSWDTMTRPELMNTVAALEGFLRAHPALDGVVGEASALR